MRASALLCAGVALAACSSNPPAARGPATTTTEVRTEVRTEISTEVSPASVRSDVARTQLQGDEVRGINLAKYAVALRATRDTVRLRVGEVTTVASLPLTMVDSAGWQLGALPLYDVEMGSTRIVEMEGMSVRGVRPGVQLVTFRIPKPFLAAGVPAAPAVLYFRVE